MSAPLVASPSTATFIKGRYTCAAGKRGYLLYVPTSIQGQAPQGLIVMLHGALQDPEDFALGVGMNALAEAHGLLVAYPAQTSGDNMMRSWNWFRPGDQQRGAGEPAIIAGLTESLRDEYAVPADRVFAAGLSAGGAMAAILGETYPELYAAIGVHSGLAHGSANDVFSALTVMRGPVQITQTSVKDDGPGTRTAPRLIVFHGSADTTVHPSNAGRIVAGEEGKNGEASLSDHASLGGVRAYTRLIAARDNGAHGIESWTIEGAEHGWSGGHPGGSYTDPTGPEASAAMVRFFLAGASDAEVDPLKSEATVAVSLSR
jgi:poly(hydroxyalkanoate) depolymerase family esterase